MSSLVVCVVEQTLRLANRILESTLNQEVGIKDEA
jgi:hypothetical protein